MSDVALLAIMVAAFALAIGLVQVLGRLIESGRRDDWAAEPPDPAGNNRTALAPDVAGDRAVRQLRRGGGRGPGRSSRSSAWSSPSSS